MREFIDKLIEAGVSKEAIEMYDLIANYIKFSEEVSYVTYGKTMLESIVEDIMNDLKKYTVTKQENEI